MHCLHPKSRLSHFSHFGTHWVVCQLLDYFFYKSNILKLCFGYDFLLLNSRSLLRFIKVLIASFALAVIAMWKLLGGFVHVMQKLFCLPIKGQLISKLIFHGFPYSKKPTKFITFFHLVHGGWRSRYHCFRESAAQDGPNGQLSSYFCFFNFWLIKT